MHVIYLVTTILAALANGYAACLNFVGAESVKVVADRVQVSRVTPVTPWPVIRRMCRWAASPVEFAVALEGASGSAGRTESTSVQV
jgi:hypothetical protein